MTTSNDSTQESGLKVRWAILLYLLVVALLAALTYYDARQAVSAEPERASVVGASGAESSLTMAPTTAEPLTAAPGDADPAAGPWHRVFWMLTMALVLFIASLPLFFALTQRLRDANAELDETLAEYQRDMDQSPSLDELTGQFNRPGLERLLDSELVRCKRHGLDCCVAALELDGFAELRAERGQSIADAVLLQCAARLASIIRGCDILGLLDTERFGLILPQTALENGIIAAERVRQVLAETRIGMPDSDKDIQVTASVGITSAREAEIDRDLLLRLAQRRLERAVETGRDRVVSVDD
jgi:diguanylate cyclase (GGDEF)-like protein